MLGSRTIAIIYFPLFGVCPNKIHELPLPLRSQIEVGQTSRKFEQVLYRMNQILGLSTAILRGLLLFKGYDLGWYYDTVVFASTEVLWLQVCISRCGQRRTPLPT